VALPQSQIDDVIVVFETLLSCEVAHVAHLQIRVFEQVLVDEIVLFVNVLVVVEHCCQTQSLYRFCHHVEACTPIHIRVQHDLNLVWVYLKTRSFASFYDCVKYRLLQGCDFVH